LSVPIIVEINFGLHVKKDNYKKREKEKGKKKKGLIKLAIRI
jgi:hypothetical protein